MDDADRINEREALAADRARGVKERYSTTYFECRLGKRESTYPEATVVSGKEGAWLALGWSRVAESEGKVRLAWTLPGTPKRPSR